MNQADLRSIQAPLKEKYRLDPESAFVTLRAEANLGEGVTCSVNTARAIVEAGLHPATGGSGAFACSGDMLLEALVACAGVTMNAVATSLGIELRGARIEAQGDLDFRGTLGVSKEATVGFREIRLGFDIDSDVTEEQQAKLIELTERYCVVYQTLKSPPAVVASAGTKRNPL
ncbi:MAG: OsmC family protein [Candidatus Eisenbacteria bacterium]